MCLLWTGSDVFLSTTSILHLCAIALHRCMGIAMPLRVRSRQNKGHVVALLLPVWGVSLAIALPLVVMGLIDQDPVLKLIPNVGLQCGIFHRTFAVYSSLVSFFVPLAIMVVADIRSVVILRQNVMSTRRSPTPRSMTSRASSDLELKISDVPVPGSAKLAVCATSSSDQQQQFTNGTSTHRRPSRVAVPSSACPSYLAMLSGRAGLTKTSSRERRAERTLVWVFVVFVLLWMPFFVTNLTYGLCRSCIVPGEVFTAFTWLGYISSGVNPAIYTVLNRDFRRAFRLILLCRRAHIGRKSVPYL